VTCDDLAYTGLGVQLGPLLIIAIACLFGGALLLLLSRRRGRAVTAVLMLFVSGAAMAITAGTPTPAMADECPPADNSQAADTITSDPIGSLPPPIYPANNSLTIVQTSVMEGLAPGGEPKTIAGIVSNNGTDSTFITAIKVEIVGVVIGDPSSSSVCDPSDYYLLDPRMRVGQILGPGGFTTFTGAAIGFSNKSTNQDACKGATIQLLYTANPS
jgi:hypothetical protein